MQQHFLTYAFAITSLLWTAIDTDAADPLAMNDAELDKSLGKLQLVGGDVYRGEFGQKDDASGALVWRCPTFASDLVIPWSVVESIVQPQAKSKTDNLETKLEFIVELQNGEAITGTVTDINDEFLTLDSALAGKKQLPMAEVRSILRCEPTSESSIGVTVNAALTCPTGMLM